MRTKSSPHIAKLRAHALSPTKKTQKRTNANARKKIDAKIASGFKKGISSKTLDEALQIAVAAENYTVKGLCLSKIIEQNSY